MRVPRSAVVLAAVLPFAACGGSTPTAPSPAAAFQIASGNYTLSIYAAPRPPAGSPGVSLMTCLSVGPAPHAISLPVTAGREGAVWSIRPAAGTLTITLREVQGGVDGTLAGSATHDSVTVRINQSTNTAASVSAPTIGVASLSGFVEGEVHFSSLQGAGSCSSNGWALTRR